MVQALTVCADYGVPVGTYFDDWINRTSCRGMTRQAC